MSLVLAFALLWFALSEMSLWSYCWFDDGTSPCKLLGEVIWGEQGREGRILLLIRFLGFFLFWCTCHCAHIDFGCELSKDDGEWAPWPGLKGKWWRKQKNQTNNQRQSKRKGENDSSTNLQISTQSYDVRKCPKNNKTLLKLTSKYTLHMYRKV